MIHSHFAQVSVLVDYTDPVEKLATSLGITNGYQRKIQLSQDWNILPKENTNTSQEWKEITFFEYEERCVARQVLRHMCSQSLRPVIFPEFVATIMAKTGIRSPIVCLGTMWGDLGQELQIAWINNDCQLLPFGNSWSQGTVFPAIHYTHYRTSKD